jgi:hypothetical protein
VSPALLLLLAAAPTRLAVLPVLSGPGVTASMVFSTIDDAAALRTGLRVMSIDDYFFHEGGALANRALACGQDTACIGAQLEPFQADLGLVVVIDVEITPPLLSLILIDTKKREVVDEHYAQVEGDREALFSRLRAESGAMLDRRGYARSGRLLVRTTPAKAEVKIAGQRADIGTPNQFTLPPGTYAVEASAEGYEAASGNAVVTSGATTELPLSLAPMTSFLDSPWPWIVGATVVVGAAVAVGVAAGSTTEACVCFVTADVACACPR